MGNRNENIFPVHACHRGRTWTNILQNVRFDNNARIGTQGCTTKPKRGSF